MSEENKTVELKKEELEKVSGGSSPPNPFGTTIQVVCPDCGYVFDEYLSGNRPSPRASALNFCPTCKTNVHPTTREKQ